MEYLLLCCFFILFFCIFILIRNEWIFNKRIKVINSLYNYSIYLIFANHNTYREIREFTNDDPHNYLLNSYFYDLFCFWVWNIDKLIKPQARWLWKLIKKHENNIEKLKNDIVC